MIKDFKLFEKKESDIDNLYSAIKRLEYMYDEPKSLRLDKFCESSNLPPKTEETLRDYVKWIIIPNLKTPYVYQWVKKNKLTRKDAVTLIEKIEECQQILRDIEINKKRDDYNVTEESVSKILNLLLYLKLNYSEPNEKTPDRMGVAAQAFTSLRKRGNLIKVSDDKYQFIWDGIPDLDDAFEWRKIHHLDMQPKDINQKVVDKIFDLLKILYLNYNEKEFPDGRILRSKIFSDFQISQQLGSTLKDMKYLVHIKTIGKNSYYKYSKDIPTIEDAIEVYKNQNSGFTAKDLK